MMSTVVEHIEMLSLELRRLHLALNLLKASIGHEADPIISNLESRIVSKTRVIEAGLKFVDMMSGDGDSYSRVCLRDWTYADRSFLPGIREKHYQRLCDRRLSESDYWLLVFRGVLIDDFKHPSVTCSRCSGVIDIANANVIPLIMREYMPQCICDTAHFNSGWKTAKVPLHDDRTFAGLVEQMIAKNDKECGE